ncbi:uncharacterized protein LOC119417273, partial [Nematolebias whitei]|uniref:uncharacterized protein LOC119417273 n=1 Tax=Nematolebias whitei TaxID=451745 RepID=UPI0018973748
MTSYHELTAEEESSLLLTDSCRAEEVRNLNLLHAVDTHPELCSPQEEDILKVDAACGFYSKYVTLCSPPLPPPPPPPSQCEPLGGFCTPASSRVPWRRRARGSPTRGDSNNNTKESQHFCLKPHEETHNSLNNDSKSHLPVNSDCEGDDGRKKTFEWMKVKRSHHLAARIHVTSDFSLVPSDLGALHLCSDRHHHTGTSRTNYNT